MKIQCVTELPPSLPQDAVVIRVNKVEE